MADEQPPPAVVVEPPPSSVADPLLPAVVDAPPSADTDPLDVTTALLPPGGLQKGRSPSQRKSRARSSTPLRPRSQTPLMRHQEKSNTPIAWRSITPYLDREEHEKTPFELGTNILLQLASYHAIFDMAAVIDISQPVQRPASAIISEHSVLDRAAIMDISYVEYVYIEDDDLLEDGSRAPPAPAPSPVPASIVAPKPAPVPSPGAFVGAVPIFVVPPPPPPVVVKPVIVEPIRVIAEPLQVLEAPPPPPTPVNPTPEAVLEAPVEEAPVKKKRKMVRMTKKRRAMLRAKKEKLRKKKLAEAEAARKAEEIRKAEEARIAAEEEERRLQEEEEEEERLRLEAEAEAEALALAEAEAAEEEADGEGEGEAEEDIVIDDTERDSSPERFIDPDKDLGKWKKLSTKQLQKGVVRGRYDQSRPEKLTEHQRDMEWQRKREAKRLPRICVHLKDVAVQQGQNIKLSCSVTGPNLVIKWYRDGEQIERDTKYKMQVSDGIISLEIVRAVPNDTGRYRCRLVNDNGEAVSSANVTVTSRLKKKPVPPMFTVVRGMCILNNI